MADNRKVEAVQDGVFQVIGQPSSDRASRIKELYDRGFTWADLDNEEYWLDQLVVMQRQTYDELHNASKQLWNIFDKAARFVIGKRELYKMLSIPQVLWDSLDTLDPNPRGLLSRYARFDFSISPEGQIKLLELNSDTPTGYVEAAIATPWVCEQYGIQTPNLLMAKQVEEAWAHEKPEYAACVAYGTHVEDTGTIDALVRHSGRKVCCVDCLDLWVDHGVLKDAEHRRIESLFALYPKEWMGVDDGGEALAYAIETGNVRITNSPHAIILQSKGLQAVVWGLHELGLNLFTSEEHHQIETYMLPTYDTPVFEGDYVSKSMFGREGGSVKMYDNQGHVDVKDEEGFDTGTLFPLIYQARAELPRLSFHSGDFHLLTGMFVINGTPCGLLGRAGGLITGNTSHFVAIGVR